MEVVTGGLRFDRHVERKIQVHIPQDLGHLQCLQIRRFAKESGGLGKSRSEYFPVASL